MISLRALKRWFGFTSPAREPIRRKIALSLETLEDRLVPATIWQSIDGTGNNLAHPLWGSAGSDFLRVAPAEYADGISTPAGPDRPNARLVSNTLASQDDATPTNDRQMSAFIYAWGQFIDHDLDLTMSASPAEAFNIAVPTGDAQFDPLNTGTQAIPLNRSNYDPATGTSSANPRQQVNSITAWIDGSMVYGSDADTAASLRTLTGGRLKTSDGNLLPTDADGNFLAGDIRVNENPELTSLQTLFVREHNRLADQIASKNPGLSDEEIFQRARRVVIGEIQSITVNEFLPALLGSAAPRGYRGYNPNVNPNIANEFSTAAFRIGHSLVGDEIEFLDNDGNALRDPLALRDAFFNTTVVAEVGIDPILKYLASDRAEEVDTKVIDDLRNFLFGPPGAGGLDLAALNIQRGRDHGLADYNATRVAYGLKPVRSFADITSNAVVQEQLRQVYGSVDKVDLWVGGLAEDHLRGASVGPTFARIISDQFARLRDGDRFWFERAFSGKDLADLRRNTLADVIRRNTELTNLQANVFFFNASITGRVFTDLNQNGQIDRTERGIGGRLVQLLDLAGNVVATALTRPDGSYRFDNLDLGTYQVRVVAPNATQATAQTPQTIKITRGMTVSNVNFTEAAPKKQAPPLTAPLPGLQGN